MKTIKRQLRSGFVVCLDIINLGIGMLHSHLKAETKTSPATRVLRNRHSTCFEELTYGFILSISAAVPLRVVWDIDSHGGFMAIVFKKKSIDYRYHRTCDSMVMGKSSDLEIGKWVIFSNIDCFFPGLAKLLER